MPKKIISPEDKELNNIRDNYPEVWEWMQVRARGDHKTMIAILRLYPENITVRKHNETLII